MAKFNIAAFKGTTIPATTGTTGETAPLGGGLLNPASMALANKEYNFKLLPLDDIIPASENEGMTMDNIPDLKLSILENGLDQPLVVLEQADSKYKLLSGHRRLMALTELLAEGNEKFKNAPCIVKSLDKIDLPLTDEMKEVLARTTTNVEVRNNTPGDKLKLMQDLSLVYDALKAAGYEKLGGRREYLAERLGISTGAVATINTTEKNLTPSLREGFHDSTLPLTVAAEIAKLPEEQQEKLATRIESTSEIPSVEEVKTFAKKEEVKTQKKKIKADFDEDTTYKITPEIFEDLKADFDETLTSIGDGFSIDKKGRVAIREIEISIAKQLQKLDKLIKSSN